MKNNILAPICLFTYNRLIETKQTIEALKSNYLASESDLFIFSEGGKDESSWTKVRTIRQYIRSITGFKSVTFYESEKNKGLANSIITGVTQIIEKYGKVIVLEDDLITTPNFLNFMNQALELYGDDKNIQSINGYSLFIKSATNDVYFQQRPFSWGWATWSDRWETDLFDKQKLRLKIENDSTLLNQFKEKCGADISKMLTDSIENKNDSWYVRWAFNHFEKDNYSVYSSYSLVENIGFNGTGTHCNEINPYYSLQIDLEKISFNFKPFIKPTKQITHEFLNYFSIRHKIKVRILLLKSKTGRKKVIEDFIIKINNIKKSLLND